MFSGRKRVSAAHDARVCMRLRLHMPASTPPRRLLGTDLDARLENCASCCSGYPPVFLPAMRKAGALRFALSSCATEPPVNLFRSHRFRSCRAWRSAAVVGLNPKRFQVAAMFVLVEGVYLNRASNILMVISSQCSPVKSARSMKSSVWETGLRLPGDWQIKHDSCQTHQSAVIQGVCAAGPIQWASTCKKMRRFGALGPVRAIALMERIFLTRGASVEHGAKAGSRRFTLAGRLAKYSGS
jgi:hypothetical protein